MDKERAIKVLTNLSLGRDSRTGAIIPDGRLYLSDDVRNALSVAVYYLTQSSQTREDRHERTMENEARMKGRRVCDVPLQEIRNMLDRWEEDVRIMMDSLEQQDARKKAGRKWTSEELQKLKDLYEAHVPLDEICHLLERRERGVRNMLISLKLMPDTRQTMPGRERAGLPWIPDDFAIPHEMYEKRAPVKKIAERLHRSEYAVFCQMEHLGLYGDEEGYPPQDMRRVDKDALRDMCENGATDDEMAQHFDISVNAVRAYLVYSGIRKGSLGFMVPHNDV
ncbi:MAG: hypothetical protein E7317_03665 [Clostridiales bacterium]|nr:hypothetical protein [Clostridiales bacterium]